MTSTGQIGEIGSCEVGPFPLSKPTSSFLLSTRSAKIPTIRTDVLIVTPSLLEPGGKRGGIELIDWTIATIISQSHKVEIVGPFPKVYTGKIVLTPTLRIRQVAFPARPHLLSTSRVMTWVEAGIGLPLYGIALALVLVRLCRRKPKVLIVHNGLPGLVASLVAKPFGCRIIFSEGNTIPWTSPYIGVASKILTRRLARFFLRCSGVLIARLSHTVRAQSHAIKKGMASAGVSTSRIVVIPAGVDTRAFRAGLSRSGTGVLRAGFVGRLVDEKGVPLLVAVVKESNVDLPQVRFAIFGDGPHGSSLRKMPNVEHVGWIIHDALPEALSKVDVVLSFQEELGLAEIEAMSSGSPLIALRADDTSQFVQDGVNGLLCDANPRSYLGALRVLCANRELLSRMSERVRQTAIDCFDWELIAKQWLSLVAPFV